MPAGAHRRSRANFNSSASWYRNELQPCVFGESAGAVNPHEFYPFCTRPNFEGVISGDGRWKLHLPHEYRTLVEAGRDGAAGKYRQARIELSLFDMEKDPLETTDVIGKFPEVAARLKGYAEQHQREFYG